MSVVTASRPNDLESFWMPFTANRRFKGAPRLLAKASGVHYFTPEGRQVLDGTAGLWCVNAGHCRPEITEAIQAQAAEMDFAPTFQMGHPLAFELAARVAELAPADLDRVFFCNSGSEAVDTALKIALAYHRARGQGQRTRFVGRERGYHGVGFGGMSVGGIGANKKQFGATLPNVSHLPHTHMLDKNAFARGQPEHGAELADHLERLVGLHMDTIAAVIVEPMAGSTGVLIPPRGYLERLRAICDKHGILLIFDEVITGFGRLGANFASERFNVIPDMITCAKGITNAAVPMGAVICREHLYDAVVNGAPDGIELFHGYTYSAHPLACAAGLATLDVHRKEDLSGRVRALESYWEDCAHALRGLPNVIDVRNIGLVAGVELAPMPGKATERAYQIFVRCFEKGLLTRVTGDIVALSPPLTIEKPQIDEIFAILSEAIRAVD
ncbi:MAG: aspartate aminotransferase family protein [Alphaproteobacteria bacterium]|nr:aspartate aminotransferase family protein [Alphaproteobacteria bacterium]